LSADSDNGFEGENGSDNHNDGTEVDGGLGTYPEFPVYDEEEEHMYCIACDFSEDNKLLYNEKTD
jgi:hypothetical protein